MLGKPQHAIRVEPREIKLPSRCGWEFFILGGRHDHIYSLAARRFVTAHLRYGASVSPGREMFMKQDQAKVKKGSENVPNYRTL